MSITSTTCDRRACYACDVPNVLTSMIATLSRGVLRLAFWIARRAGTEALYATWVGARHFKGGRYAVLALAKSTETCEDFVVYVSTSDSQVWVRPAREFLGSVQVGGEHRARFEFEVLPACVAACRAGTSWGTFR